LPKVAAHRDNGGKEDPKMKRKQRPSGEGAQNAIYARQPALQSPRSEETQAAVDTRIGPRMELRPQQSIQLLLKTGRNRQQEHRGEQPCSYRQHGNAERARQKPKRNVRQ
jgi:hypothetical protein